MKKKSIANLFIKKIKIANLKGGITDPCPGSTDDPETCKHACGSLIVDETQFETCVDGEETNYRTCGMTVGGNASR